MFPYRFTNTGHGERDDTKGAGILILDDEQMVVDNIMDLIELETNFTVFPETDPFKALQTLKQNNISLIITDFLMPEMNGIDFLIKAKKKR